MSRLRATVAGIALLFLLAGAAHAAFSPATVNGWFITAGRVQGLTGSLFRTDVWLFNPDSTSEATVTLVFHPAALDGQPGPASVGSGPIVLLPGETRFFPDATLATVPAGDGAVGALEWSSSMPIMGGARIYTVPSGTGGTYGFFLPATPISESLAATTSSLQIFGMNSADANFRTNLDVTNTSSVDLGIEVRVIDPATGESYGGPQDHGVAAKSLLRLGQILTAAGAPPIPGLRITVAVKETVPASSGGILASGYTLDNRTDDAFAFVGQPASADAGSVVTRTVRPSDTSPSIEPTIGDHYVATPPASRRLGRLLVFYPGTGGRPDQYSSFIRRAAALGYDAIGLAYNNFDSINFDVCPRQPDSCPELARLEILLGTESGYTPPDVDPDNAAFNRLIQLLRYLDSNHPDEGWGGYLDAGGMPAWERIAFGGHSQGGGHAAMTGKLHLVDRVLLFAATEPAAWTSGTFATPAERFFGLAHTLEDSFVPITGSWENIGLPGALASVDQAPAPFGGSHRLSTSVPVCGGDPSSRGYFHNCPVVDGYFPFAADGITPLFQPVWDHLLTSPVP